MAEEAEQERGELGKGAGSDALAAQIALNANGETAAEAREYLRKQSRLADLQIEELRKEDRIRHWSLRVRHTNDLLKLAFGMSAAAVALLVVVAAAASVWNAFEATGLVIQPLKAPPDFVQRGLDGTVLAQRLLDKLNTYVGTADKWSFRSADSISGNWGDDSKVEIPQTGISLFELSRFLRHWLGHETSMSGELYHTPTGIALTVRAGSSPGTTFEGKDEDVDALLSRAAQSLLADTQPYRYIWLLYTEGRPATSIVPIARRFAQSASPEERTWLRSALEEQMELSGDLRGGLAYSLATIESVPGHPVGYLDAGPPEWVLGRLEAAHQHIQTGERLLSGANRPADFAADQASYLVENCRSIANDIDGADGDAVVADIAEMKTGKFDFEVSAPASLANDLALEHDVAAARAVIAQYHVKSDDIVLRPEYLITTGPALPHFFAEAVLDDWVGASATLVRIDQAVAKRQNVEDLRHTLIWPWLAYSFARTGRASAADDVLSRTPSDCTLCLEMRGRLAESKSQDAVAARWYARAIADAPSLPFSYTDWGKMLLKHGDIEGAIAQFQSANKANPHYADAIELWSEALMLKHRSDLALAKFEEANKYAPHWGRLHMKWGEALGYVGRKDEARAQYRTASTLDLSAADESELARDVRG